jgi:hypothetical protein
MQWCEFQVSLNLLIGFMREFIIHSFFLFFWFQVHHGFYSAYHNTTIRPGILNAVERAKKYYGDLNIIVTGHSMGGAMAAFCGLDLVVIMSDHFLKQAHITHEQIFIGVELWIF